MLPETPSHDPRSASPIPALAASIGGVVAVQLACLWLGIEHASTFQRERCVVVALVVTLVAAGGVLTIGRRASGELDRRAIGAAVALAAFGVGAMLGMRPLAGWLAERALGGWVASAELAELERTHGYSSCASCDFPQVSRPDGDEPLGYWTAAESDRATGTEPLAPHARGALVLASPDPIAGAVLRLDDAQSLLGRRAAREPGEVAWVALLSRSWPVRYEYAGGGGTMAERVDVRIVDVAAGRVIARASIGAIAPRTIDRVMPRYAVSDEIVARTVSAVLDADGTAAPAPEPAWDAEGCEVAETLQPTGEQRSDACLEGATRGCDAACRRGDTTACREAGYTLEHASDARARVYYALGCRAGSANACTNFAAGLVHSHRDDDAALACARRVFERTCEAGEHWGCGMFGRLLAEGRGGEEDDARASALLAASCDDGNSFSCEGLGHLLVAGELGAPDRDAGLARLRRGCELGSRDACRAAEALE